MRRQTATLVDAGLIVRRDRPYGKRHARKDGGGEIKLAFGPALGPLVARAEEFQRLAEQLEAEARAIRLAKEQITLCR
jgi:replication initiation protein RepC